MPFLVLARRRLAAAAPAALLGACVAESPAPAGAVTPHPSSPPAAEEPAPFPWERPDGRVEIAQTQAGSIGDDAWGSGTLIHRGRRRPFRIRGLGIEGLEAVRVAAVGEVYDMLGLADFPGLYGPLRAGPLGGGADVRGGMWLENPAGVRLNLRARRVGLVLQVHADGMPIKFR